ncbi:hypothetical protein C491_17459 [Natronococcus amylolyticus DSM 10524]|uniref:Uncharacterized protein n=1 Tax=Natronococcus amylolyticus DSM 10524 TaxID=1227497 RepID=L9WZT9_9EURY|nr:hypothetical protein [Natronococcus amylolyticus]ELY54907.1 hypothetical protein C491_17459 [Natronococcus amylolyticus DSM 10524]
MRTFNRRRLLASGTALGGAGLFGSLSTAAEEHDEEAEPEDVAVEYEYTLAGEGDDDQLDDRLELSSGAYYYTNGRCYVTFDADNVSDDRVRVDFYATVDDHGTWDIQERLEPGESTEASLELLDPDDCSTDPEQLTITARGIYVGEPDEAPEDDDPEAEDPDDEDPDDEDPDDEEPEDDDPEAEDPDDDEPEDDDPEAEEPDDDDHDDEPEAEIELELSVSAPDSVPHEETADPSEDAADFCITVTNHGGKPVSVDGRFEIGPLDEPLPLELESGETDTVDFGVMSRDLGPGDHEWTVSANGETETGTLTVTDDEGC